MLVSMASHLVVMGIQPAVWEEYRASRPTPRQGGQENVKLLYSQITLSHTADEGKVDKEEGVVWLHGTIRLGIARAENVPLHQRLHCHDPCTRALDACMGYVGNRRHRMLLCYTRDGPC